MSHFTSEKIVLPVLEEEIVSIKQNKITCRVKIDIETIETEHLENVQLFHQTIEITHKPIGQIVETAPEIRQEGQTMIIPVIEEIAVIVKKLFLKEEIHIHQSQTSENKKISLSLKKQQVKIERNEVDESFHVTK